MCAFAVVLTFMADKNPVETTTHRLTPSNKPNISFFQLTGSRFRALHETKNSRSPKKTAFSRSVCRLTNGTRVALLQKDMGTYEERNFRPT